MEPKIDNSIDLINLECLSECHQIPRKFPLIFHAVTIENHRESYDLLITIKLDQSQRPYFKHSRIAINLKEKLPMNNPLLIEINNPDDAQVKFILNDYNQIFEINEKFGLVSIQVSFFSIHKYYKF